MTICLTADRLRGQQIKYNVSVSIVSLCGYQIIIIKQMLVLLYKLQRQMMGQSISYCRCADKWILLFKSTKFSVWSINFICKQN